MPEIQRHSLKMLCNGLALTVAGDLRPQGKFNFLKNIRIAEEGVITSRPVLGAFLDLANALTIPNNIKKIINKANGDFLFIVSTNTGELFTGDATPLALKEAGFSGKPPTIIDFRPEQSLQAYAYIADENKFKKVSVDDTISDVGITAPIKSVIFQIGKPERKVIDLIDAASIVDWNNLSGSATPPTLANRVDTTITTFIPDDAIPGFASIVPAIMPTQLQAGSILTINGVDNVFIDEVLPSAIAAGVATISNIKYDAGLVGLCTIVLSISNHNIKRNSILKLNGAEYVRVLDVTFDGNDIPSIRTKTVGTFVAGNSIEGAPAFRFFSTANYIVGQTIKNDAIKVGIGADGISSFTRVFNVDLTNTGTKSLTEEDVIHLGLQVSDSSAISEIQVQFDVDSITNDFTRNYFFYPISPNFFTAAATQTTPTPSIIQQIIQRQQLFGKISRLYSSDFPEGFDRGIDPESYAPEPVAPIPGQTALGIGQWAEIDIKQKDLKRVGTDISRTLKDVKAIRISVNSTAAVDVSLDSIWIGGADALSSSQQGFFPYNYVWRIRNPATGEISNWSPPLRNGVTISRGRVELSFPEANINFPANYKIDIARFGGNLTTWRLVGSIKNDGTKYIDTSSDRIIADNAPAGRFDSPSASDTVFDYYKPFAILDSPKSGTCDVTGTIFKWQTGDKLNITYPRGVQILINGIANKFFSNPSDTETVELERDMGNLNDVPFEIQEPLLTGQPLPVVFGPVGEGNFGLYIFGFGDKNAPGTIYWLDGNSPGTQSDLNRLEISSPSEPLIAGVIYDGFAFVWSISRSWMIMPTFSNDGTFSYIARENANSRGCFSRWAICVSPTHIFHISENADGIYKVQGNGNPLSITKDAIDNLFFNNGEAPKEIVLYDGTIINPPDWTKVEQIRLFSTNDFLFFKFRDLLDSDIVVVFDIKIENWISFDTYLQNRINAIYLEEDDPSKRIFVGITGKIAQFGALPTIETIATTSQITPFAFDAGDSRFIKEFKEVLLDLNPGTEDTELIINFNNGDETNPPEILSGVAQRGKQIINLQNDQGEGVLAENIGSTIKWPTISETKLYEQIIYFIPKADETTDRSSDIEHSEGIGDRLWQGVIIRANTFGEDKELNYYDDKRTLKATLIINHDGEQTIAYSFPNPFISHSVRRTSDDNTNWLPIAEAYVTDPEPEAAKVWEGEFDTTGLSGLKIINRMGIAYRSNADATVKLTFNDGGIHLYNLPNSNGNWQQEFFYNISKKWKGCKYRIESEEPIRIYKNACEVWMKSYNSNSPFQRMQPFGGPSNVGVLI